MAPRLISLVKREEEEEEEEIDTEEEDEEGHQPGPAEVRVKVYFRGLFRMVKCYSIYSIRRKLGKRWI